jgi:hypothetical protein
MADSAEIYLGNNWHTLFSDELWYLIVLPSAVPFLEGRFQTDAPDRTGWPTWVSADYCIHRTTDAAICRLQLTRTPAAGERNRFASISDEIWNRCVEECEKLLVPPNQHTPDPLP